METVIDSGEKRETVVWITNYAGHEYEDAKRFGVLKQITSGHISFASLDRIKFTIASAVAETHKDDYLVLSGANIVCVLSAIIWFQLHEQIKILNWDKFANNSTGGYREMLITKSNLTELIEFLLHQSQ